ncbi:hypothetical protein FHP29_04190 [Nocardioides albidus]|uniref:Uncharacterized protein n=1 Tax=Nocardioides albidus TaxID=1517589 RepID=A0A5C4WD36_9ACTN|nr:hypothetical protein [Nocardioides albidus]TNM46128.1 hypothetical protein FHP29_04190 [Nocardioides albidus]
MSNEEGSGLPPAPTPVAESPAPPPGGPHRIEGVGGDGAYTTEGRDPQPSENPATDDELPAETTTPEDTDTEATKGNPEVPPDQESPA